MKRLFQSSVRMSIKQRGKIIKQRNLRTLQRHEGKNLNCIYVSKGIEGLLTSSRTLKQPLMQMWDRYFTTIKVAVSLATSLA